MYLEDLNALLQKIELFTQQANLKNAEEGRGSLTAYSPSLPNMLFFINGGVTVSGMPISSQLYYAHVREFVYDRVEGSANQFLMDVFADFGYLGEEDVERLKSPDADLSMLYLMNVMISSSGECYTLPFVTFSLCEVQGWTVACNQATVSGSSSKTQITLNRNLPELNFDFENRPRFE